MTRKIASILSPSLSGNSRTTRKNAARPGMVLCRAIRSGKNPHPPTPTESGDSMREEYICRPAKRNNDYSVVFGQEKNIITRAREILTAKLFQRALLGAPPQCPMYKARKMRKRKIVGVIYESVASNVTHSWKIQTRCSFQDMSDSFPMESSKNSDVDTPTLQQATSTSNSRKTSHTALPSSPSKNSSSSVRQIHESRESTMFELSEL